MEKWSSGTSFGVFVFPVLLFVSSQKHAFLLNQNRIWKSVGCEAIPHSWGIELLAQQLSSTDGVFLVTSFVFVRGDLCFCGCTQYATCTICYKVMLFSQFLQILLVEGLLKFPCMHYIYPLKSPWNENWVFLLVSICLY